MTSSREQLVTYLDNYISSTSHDDEFEIRFGTMERKIHRIDFDNIIKKLKQSGFSTSEVDAYSLRIRNRFTEARTGREKVSNMRTEVRGLHNIQEYCKTNALAENMFSSVEFALKQRKETTPPIDFPDLNFRVSLQTERRLAVHNSMVKSTLDSWKNSKKTFRFMKRTTLTNSDYPGIKVDCSIVKMSKKNRYGRLIPEYLISESGVFADNETYEVEIELLKSALDDSTIHDLRYAIKLVMSGWQESNYPIGNNEQERVLRSYMSLVYGGEPPDKPITSRDFVGPSAISLEMDNIRDVSANETTAPNVRYGYTVTDKADGLRKLLFIGSTGKMYLIDTNMHVQFTGCIADNERNTLIDGEHVLQDKAGNFIDSYMCFDLYVRNKVDLRSLPLIVDAVDLKADTRLYQLNETIRGLKFDSVVEGGKPSLRVAVKAFYMGPSERAKETKRNSIFGSCKKILDKIDAGLFEYETDGVMFTPANMGVGISTKGTPVNTKRTWPAMFKWKPSRYNTVDFLVTTKKTEAGSDITGNIYEDGVSTRSLDQLTEYKTLILRVGYDERKHGYINPCQAIIDDDLPKTGQRYAKREDYKPLPFYPSNPADPKAYICNVVLERGLMKIEDNTESFTDGTIVEFRYDMSRPTGFRWIPIKVRYDKTAEYRAGGKNYGNAYHVAESVWRSIHNPITSAMLSSGDGIPNEFTDSTVYYNRQGASNHTRALRNFHNLYVKRKLILSVSKRGGTLIDLSVGKGGDFPKWIAAKLSFVFGLDISRDNIENRVDGVCARYLDNRKRFNSMPRGLFVNGDTTENIRSGEAMYTDKGKMISRAVFGDGPKDEDKLGTGVYLAYGKGKPGFDVVSCQFSMHYFFENQRNYFFWYKNQRTLQGFLRNVSEVCKVGGYFIGTCYDGRRVFRLLEDFKQNDGIAKFSGDAKIWEIVKQYDSDVFKANATSVGYGVDVYQESINKVFREYLVEFTYFVHLMQLYGFAALTDKDAREIGLPHGIGSFEALYGEMEQDIIRNKRVKDEVGNATKMTPEEKYVSFLNNYYVFRKVNDVDAKEVYQSLTGLSAQEEDEENDESAELARAAAAAMKSRIKVRKLKKRIRLQAP